MCLHLNHPAGDQVGPHEPAGDHLHKPEVPLLLLSFFCRLLSELGFWIPWSSSRAPPPLRSQGSPVPMSPWVSQAWCSSRAAAAACADWGRGGSAAPHIVCPTSCHCAPTSTLPGIGCRSRRRGLPGVNIKAARGEYQKSEPPNVISLVPTLCCLSQADSE